MYLLVELLRQQMYKKTSLNITQLIFCVTLGKHMADAQKGRFVWIYFLLLTIGFSK